MGVIVANAGVIQTCRRPSTHYIRHPSPGPGSALGHCGHDTLGATTSLSHSLFVGFLHVGLYRLCKSCKYDVGRYSPNMSI